MNIYTLLEKKRRKRNAFEETQEFEFFIKNREVLNKISRFDFLYNRESSEFDVIRANIIIESYLNKIAIEEEVANIASQTDIEKLDQGRFINILKEKIVDLPYLTCEKTKIYVPFFTLPLNIVYTKFPEKLLAYPYNQLKEEFSESIIDLFDTYGTALYDSYFTRLVKIGTNGKEVAFFNYDTNTIYIVNSQGRLDNKIVLFDKYLKRPVENHMLERLKPLIECYFFKTREEFVKALYDNMFISEKIYNILSGKEEDDDE